MCPHAYMNYNSHMLKQGTRKERDFAKQISQSSQESKAQFPENETNNHLDCLLRASTSVTAKPLPTTEGLKNLNQNQFFVQLNDFQSADHKTQIYRLTRSWNSKYLKKYSIF